jgi:hypothetical protein
MGIEEDEIDYLIFEDEEDVPKQGMKWTALARVHTANSFSSQTFEQHMRVAWSPAQEIIFTPLEEKIFSVQCSCLGDWVKVEQGGPWLFRQNAVSIEPYDGLAPTDSVDLNFINVWVQIHKLPIGYRIESLVRNLIEKKVGKCLSVELDVQGMGNFVRIRVRLDVRLPLARVVTVSRDKQREFYILKYEKIPKFCAFCGLFGHIHTECGNGEHDEKTLKWGDFIKADFETWKGRFSAGGRGVFGGSRGRDPSGRGRGLFGRDANVSWRFNAMSNTDIVNAQDLQDTASSPVKTKDVDMQGVENNGAGAKRGLDFDQEKEDRIVQAPDNIVGDHSSMVLDKAPGAHPAVGGTVEKDRKKRSKMGGSNSNNSVGSADSSKESVRSQ